MSTPVPAGLYQTLISGFFSNLSAGQQAAIWTQFANSEGISATTPPTDAKTEQDFIAFLANTLSPARDTVLMQTINDAIQILMALQNTVAMQANNLEFYSQWQQEYTKMITTTPTYVSNPPTNWSPSTNASSFTLGYDNISINDVAASLAQQLVNGAPAPSFTLDGPVTQINQTGYDINGNAITLNADAQLSYNFTLTNGALFTSPSIHFTNVSFSGSSNVLVADPRDPNHSPKSLVQYLYDHVADFFPPVAGQSYDSIPAAQSTFTNLTLSTPTSTSSAAFLPYTTQVANGIMSAMTQTTPTPNLSTNPNYNLVQTNIFGNPTATYPTLGIFTTNSYNAGSGATPAAIDQTLSIAIGTGNGNTPPNIFAMNFTTPLGGLTIPWAHTQPFSDTTTDTAQLQANANAAQARGEQNSALQQYIQSARANEQVVENKASTEETNLNSTKQAISDQTNLLTTIIQTLQTLVQSIFR